MIAVVKATGANFASVRFALQRLGAECEVTNSPDVVASASHVIVPGVGAAPPAMARLRAAGLDTVIPRLTQPVLGICLGMQLMFEASQEGDTTALGIFGGWVRALPVLDGYSLPHMGWNTVEFNAEFNAPAITEHCDRWAYFVHSYAAPVGPNTVATTTYGEPLAEPFSAIVARDNFVGMQFHPERSGEFGRMLLRSFLESEPVTAQP